jgi:ribonuclease G
VQSRETLALEIKRRLRSLLGQRGSSKNVLISANPWLADWLKQKDLRQWERELACTIKIEADTGLHAESFMILDNSSIDK